MAAPAEKGTAPGTNSGAGALGNPNTAPAPGTANNDEYAYAHGERLSPVNTNDTAAAAAFSDPKSEELRAELAATQGQYGDLSLEEATFVANFDEAQRKKLYRKVDWRLVPMLALLYLFSYIDRSNIGT
jgi:hypothetical protein